MRWGGSAGWARVEGTGVARLARLARLAGHGLGERETEQRERTQRSVEGTGVARGWLGVAGDGEKVQRAESESREKRVRAERRIVSKSPKRKEKRRRERMEMRRTCCLKCKDREPWPEKWKTNESPD
uniref:Uncharacterized protein n=1 Tax=Fagus sylvatica TaxID=28930 RepID=A0A2N9I0I8_FAGSY